MIFAKADFGRKISSRESPGTVRQCLRALATPLSFLKGVGPKRAAQLENLGLSTVEDLLYHLPFRYEDRREIHKIANARAGEKINIIGRLARLQPRYIPRRRSQMLVATLEDDSGLIELVWYRAPNFLISGLAKGQTMLVHGKVESGAQLRLSIVHPDFEIIEGEAHLKLQRILPVYVHPGGLSLSYLRQWITDTMANYADLIPSTLPQEIIARRSLMSIPQAL